MIVFDKVCKRYGRHEALKDVSFTVPQGQVLGLLGQNGAGKTTAMNIMTGCLAPTSGAVLLSGLDILTQPRDAKRLLGYLPENAPLYDEMTVRAYLKFACELKETQKGCIAGHLETVAEKTGLTAVMGRKIGNLSKGYRQRVGVAQALCGSPDVIVLDEPTAGLDPRQSSEMRSLILSLKGEHTVILSSHILSEVQSICDRILILHHGRLIFDSAINRLSCHEKRLRAVIACGEGTLLPQIRTLKCLKSAQAERGALPGCTQLVLTADKDAPLERELFTLLSARQWPLLRLAPVEDSLEEVFLRATGDAI